MKGFDVAEDTTGRAHKIKDLGYDFVAFYLRPDRCSKAMVDGLKSVGLKCLSIWEKGFPTSPDYFTRAQGAKDGGRAVAFAKRIGQPPGTQIFACVDYDADWKADGKAIVAYFQEFQAAVKSNGYLASVYGSGAVCEKLVGMGYAHCGWLACSSGWHGYKEYKPKAAVIQHLPTHVLGFDVDPDDVVDESVVW